MAPILRKTSIIPVLVGLIPTRFILMLAPGITAAATIRKAADEISPGTNTSRPSNCGLPFILTTLSAASISAASMSASISAVSMSASMSAPRYASILSV